MSNSAVTPTAFFYTTITNWVAYTPTISGGVGTVSAVSAKYRRVGSSMEVRGSFTAGTVSASLASISLPNGLTLDSASLNYSNTTSNAGDNIGWLQQQASGASRTASIVTCPLTSTSVVYVAGNTVAGDNIKPQNFGTGFDNNGLVAFYFSVPISQWVL